MIYLAKELLAKLTHLTLSGQNDEGELEFIGTNTQWLKACEMETNLINQNG